MSLEITTPDWGGEHEDQKFFADITKEVLGLFLEIQSVRTIKIVDMPKGNRKVRPQKDNKVFQIVIGGVLHARKEEGTLAPERMWDFTTDFRTCLDHGELFSPSGEGLVIVEPGSLLPVAELYGNNLCILFRVNDTAHMRREDRHGVYKAILKEALIMMGGNLPSLAELQAGNFKVPKRENLEQMYANLGQYRQEIDSYIAQATELAEKQRKGVADRQASDKVMNVIRNIPEVKSLSVDDNGIIIRTHRMYAQDRKEQWHELGEFEIDFRFGNNGDVTFDNITRKPNGWGHPHVQRGEGQWCKGEGTAIEPLIKNFEFEAAVLFALKAIDSVNPAYHGGYMEVLDYFPIVKKRMKYPKKTDKDLDETTSRSFARIFDQTREKNQAELRLRAEKIRLEVVAIQQKILQASMAKTVERLTSAGTDGIELVGKDERKKVKVRTDIPLDEPTSSLDAVTEARIYENIFREFEGKTIISSIHRLHLLPQFDRVCMFEDGKVIDIGTFDELLERCEPFKVLWKQYNKHKE